MDSGHCSLLSFTATAFDFDFDFDFGLGGYVVESDYCRG